MGLDERAPTPPHPSLCPGRGGSPAWTHTPPLSDPQHFPSPIKSSLTDPPALCQPHQLLSSAFSPLHSLSLLLPGSYAPHTFSGGSGLLPSKASLLFGVSTPLRRTTLQQGACTRGPK